MTWYNKHLFFFIVWASWFNSLPGRTRSRGRCRAAIRCHIIQNRQATHFTGWSMDWTVKGNMVSGLLHHTHKPQKEVILHLCKQCAEVVGKHLWFYLTRTHVFTAKTQQRLETLQPSLLCRMMEVNVMGE